MAELKADKHFLKKLKAISSNLEVEWTSGLDRWVIWYWGTDGFRYRIHEVKNPDGTYRPLDDRVLTMLRRCDYSTKVEDPAYELSEQLRKAKEYKAIERQKNIDEKQRQSRDLSSKWAKAIDNATRGIFTDRQLGRRVIYSYPTIQNVAPSLYRKFGKPHLTGAPSIINPY